MNNWQVQSFRTVDSHRTALNFGTGATEKHSFLLSNSPCKKEATTRQGMQKGANFCTTLLLFYHTSDWLNQQNLPKLQVAAYLSIFNWSTIFISTKSLLNLNTTVILCGEHWKIGGFIVFVYDCYDCVSDGNKVEAWCHFRRGLMITLQDKWYKNVCLRISGKFEANELKV